MRLTSVSRVQQSLTSVSRVQQSLTSVSRVQQSLNSGPAQAEKLLKAIRHHRFDIYKSWFVDRS